MMKSQNSKTKNQNPQSEDRKACEPQMIERIKFRPVSSSDNEFLLEVYESSREIELSMLPWDAALKRAFVEQQLNAQTTFYKEEYVSATHDIVLFDEIPVGRLYVHREPDQITILDIIILPVDRKQGIATAIIKGLQDEGLDGNKSLKIYVETFNPSQKLFAELGFEVVEEGDINLLFEWQPKKKT